MVYISIACVAALFFTWLVGRSLPKDVQNRRFQTVGLGLCVFVAVAFVSTKPLINSYSPVSDPAFEIPSDKSIETQDRRIQILEFETKRLREDLYGLHSHYSTLLVILQGAAIGLVAAKLYGRKS